MSLINKQIQLISLILILQTTSQAIAETCTSVAKLVSKEGTVEVKPSSTSIWQPAKLKQHYCFGYSLRTGSNSRAAVRMVNDTLLRIGSDTTMSFTGALDDELTFLDILKGAIHFLSRTPHSLKVTTPFVNAAVEGTEFVVRVRDSDADVTVLEGVVVASNSVGSVKLHKNQTGRAQIGQAPIRIAVTQPRDVVAWALYYPPLPKQLGPADTLAQQTVAAIAQNRLNKAAFLAKQALATDSQSAAAFMAQSYVYQAQFDIPAALSSMQKAAVLAPQSALTQARLAEVWLMTENTQAARQAAARAVMLEPNLALTQSVLGFASLREIKLDAAKVAFEKAISLDSASPLPRLGLGLVKVRRGDLKSGKEEIETAVMLDPNNALLRSYMGKAYYEEKRSRLASEQFALAKELDPNDPTAWFYDSILLQSQNQPIEALQEQTQAIRRNDNRMVYRSRQLLDKDNAARVVALGRIYKDLSFEQLARLKATSALAQNPGNHSAHRLLADSYAGVTNLDAARQSELLQSKLTQPLNLDPLQPQLSNSNLGLLDGAGPRDLSYNEYNPLFTRNGMALQIDAAVAEQDTWSENVIIAGLIDSFAFSLGQFHTETDGSRRNADYEQDIVNAFTQFNFTESTSLQFEVTRDEEDKGDVAKRLLPDLLSDPTLRIDNDTSSYRVGLDHRLTTENRLLASIIRKDNNSKSAQSTFVQIIPTQPPVPTKLRVDLDRDIDLYDLQMKHHSETHNLLLGTSYNSDDNHRVVRLDLLPEPLVDNHGEEQQTRLYFYYFADPVKELTLNGGLTVTKDNSDLFDNNKTRALPKLGAHWKPTDQTGIRIAAYRNIAPSTDPSLYQTLEPTQIVGFNQVFDEFLQTDSWNFGLALDQHLSKTLFTGFEVIYRDRETPFFLFDTETQRTSTEDIEADETLATAWLYWTPHPMWGVSLEYGYDYFKNAKNLDTSGFVSGFTPDGVLKLKTHRIPLSLSYYHPSGWSAQLSTTYFNQEGTFIDNVRGSLPQQASDEFWLTDFALSYRLPKRYGLISTGVKNLFDKNFNFEDRDSYDSLNVAVSATPSTLSNERLLFAQLSINFR